jgi:hypothetical protein
MQRPRVIENSALSAHRQVDLVRWSLAAVGEPDDLSREERPGDPLRRVAKLKPVPGVRYRGIR